MVSENPPAGWRVFLDTHVFVAGLLSLTGASGHILDLGEAEEIVIVVSQHVLMEADRVFMTKFPASLERYHFFIKNLAPQLADDPPLSLIRKAQKVIPAEDAPILAAAKFARVDRLVTFDIRHFHTPQARAFLPVPIWTPSEFLTEFRRFWERM